MREEVRAVWIPRWLDELALDFRYALRTYGRAKLFTVTVLMMMSLGIGINTTVLSLIKSGIVVADFAAWRGRARSFEFTSVR